MGRKFFEGYGELEWLEPEKYWSDAWKPIEKVGSGEDSYEIVLNGARTEYRYTIV